MAEPNQLIWIPVSSGKEALNPADSEACNVQWELEVYPADITKSPLSFVIVDSFVWDSVIDIPRLTQCYAVWAWETLYLGDDPTQGAQLGVGTPFSRIVPGIAIYDKVDVFAKVRIPVTKEISNVKIGICDSSDKVVQSINLAPGFNDNEWRVITFFKSGSWGVGKEAWDSENLRVVVLFQGPTAPTGTPPALSEVQIEWIKIYLSGDPVST